MSHNNTLLVEGGTNSFFFLECFIPSSPEDVSEAHPTPLPKSTAPAVTQEAFGAGFAGSLTFRRNPQVRRCPFSEAPRHTQKNSRHFLFLRRPTSSAVGQPV